MCTHSSRSCAHAASSRRIRYFGLGTQRVEDELRARYPGARVVRWDYDTTRGRGAHEALLDRFIRGEADVMVGTQMVAKGLDLPRVTLVGVISADTLLNLPDLRASERTFQLLTQVAGRAGRSVLGGQVIIQTYAPEHPAVVAASDHDYELFYRQEIAFRREHWYPPVSRIIRLLCTDSDIAARCRRQQKRCMPFWSNASRGSACPTSTSSAPRPPSMSGCVANGAGRSLCVAPSPRSC